MNIDPRGSEPEPGCHFHPFIDSAPWESQFSAEAALELEEMTKGVALLAKCVRYHKSGMPMVHIWKMVGDELVSLNHLLVQRGFAIWVETC
uniref:Uncharacterized protein n=1 Tax=Scleropages formosus TaxID=113540 RepID=A0A8C9VFN2_SCLFO